MNLSLEAIRHYRDNLNTMRLHNPPSVNLVKGAADPDALLQLFQEIEFASMIKRIEEFTGKKPREMNAETANQG